MFIEKTQTSGFIDLFLYIMHSTMQKSSVSSYVSVMGSTVKNEKKKGLKTNKKIKVKYLNTNKVQKQ